MFNLAILRHNRLRPVSNYLFGIVFRVFSNTFKVPQVSVLFNFQGPAPAALRTAHLLYLIKFLLSSTFLRFFWAARPFGRLAVLATACLFYFNQSLLSRPFLKFFRAAFQTALPIRLPTPCPWQCCGAAPKRCNYNTMQSWHRQAFSANFQPKVSLLALFTISSPLS